MFSVEGINGKAKIFTDLCDDKTIAQVIGILNSPISMGATVRIMPDCHAGSGSVVGTTISNMKYISPQTVGVDIGCGMLVVEMGKIDIDFKKFDECVHKIPSGHDTWLDKEYRPAGLYKEAFATSFEGFIDTLIAKRALRDLNRIKYSLATLGGGNHFIELDKDKDDNIYLVIHSGSRSLGKDICDYYTDIAYKDTNSHKKEISDLINTLKSEGRETEIEEELKNLVKSQKMINKESSYLEGEHLANYLHDMAIAQEYAKFNRLIMASTILRLYFPRLKGKSMDYILNKEFKSFTTIHNYINFNDHILRKGAVSANKGERLIIPINMHDGSLICLGKGNPDWNYSAPHGAGRILSRGEAKELIELEDYQNIMKGIYTTSVNYSTIDEAPMAYKPIESILENIKDTVDVELIIKPIYNFKASI